MCNKINNLKVNNLVKIFATQMKMGPDSESL